MHSDIVLQLLMRDLLACLATTVGVGVFVFGVAVPLNFTAHPFEFRGFPQRLLWSWFVGVAFTAGSLILLAAIVEIWMQWLPGSEHLILPFIFMASAAITVGGLALMWRAANSKLALPRRFSLRLLLLVQVVILALCGLWVTCRRGEIERLNRLQMEHAQPPATNAGG